MKPLPGSEHTSTLFATHLSSRLSWKTIKVYLAAVSHLHKSHGFRSPVTQNPTLSLALKGLQRMAAAPPKASRLPITQPILVDLLKALNCSRQWGTHDRRMLMAAFTLAFAAFLRGGEFTSSARHFNPSTHATKSDVDFSKDGTLSFYLKHSKTDQFFRGHVITLQPSGNTICPANRMKKYFHSCSAQGRAPLFHFKNGPPLSMGTLRRILRRLLRNLGYQARSFNTHSFRIGAATSAAMKGLSAKNIKQLGRWKSRCFRDYVRLIK